MLVYIMLHRSDLFRATEFNLLRLNVGVPTKGEKILFSYPLLAVAVMDNYVALSRMFYLQLVGTEELLATNNGTS
ncbi:hypothetical protein M5689_023148 [Euphorbia peplus]|nr:hypothetical protein M5689_023148 [Euphorbia peplus]